jgi:general secretion pathway protein B
MSYILEALKKSESERQQASSPPSIYSPKPPPSVEPEKQPKKSRLMLWCVLSLFVILVMTAGYQLYGNKIINITITVPEENTGSKTQVTTTKADQGPVTEVETVPESPTSLPVIEPVSKKAVTVEETSVEVEEQLQEESIDDKPAPAVTLSNNSSVPRLEELDLVFQNMVPDLKLAGHVYSEDASLRMILINDRIVRENGAAAKDFILDEITPEGIILRKGSIRFRIDIP